FKTTEQVVIEGVNVAKRHQKNKRTRSQGQIIEKSMPIHISNVALVDPSTKKPTRIGSRVETVTKNGVTKTVRVRIAKKSGKDI
ncbi:MAG: hypothetical protein RL529_1229, partial [Actinomycetota bacterium]